MDLGIAGRVALVAAGTKGIGRALAEGLQAEGCRVAVCARTPVDLPEGMRFDPVDVSQPADLERWVADVTAHLGPPDILITNTGGPPAGPWTEMTDAQWQSGVDSTLMNVVRLVRLVAPGMQERGWGRIVHVTSLVAKQPEPLLPISSTLRAGLRALVRLQARELAPHGVTVNGLLPGHTLTDRQRHLAQVRAERAGTDEEQELVKAGLSIPIGRLATPEEVAAAGLFLCSQPASYITGINLTVDGGALLSID